MVYRKYKKCHLCNGIGKLSLTHIITREDLKATAKVRLGGQTYPSFTIFGGLREHDIGKMLVLVNDLIYIENEEQYQKRIKEEN